MNRNVFRAALLVTVLAGPASAQDQVDIRFAPGASGTTINGTIVGRDYVDYVLRARGGQTMTVSLSVTGTNGNGTISFNILPAGQDYPALFVGSSEGNRAEVVLPEDGDWAIRTYLMGNDYDTGKTVGYSIDVGIGGGGGGENTAAADDGGGAMAGAAGNPPFWEVRVDTSLNVRGEPSASSRVFFQLPNGSLVRNLGCERHEGRDWCQVPTGPTDGASIGWVAAEFLVPAAAPAGGVNAVIP